ncbi:uncharacterized protein LOC130266936 [Oenanthe melanoleuca]|uniref:uncharacterized protein LOC130266936 n=1 Tax=Oenanthe melanoleuca TaxID=2939378 RepID=UPI0024C15AD9|nr:uncharacterized protein LOC130266936 [Oenanthe melanoleuca]
MPGRRPRTFLAAEAPPGPGDSRDPSLCTVGSRSPASTSCSRLRGAQRNLQSVSLRLRHGAESAAQEMLPRVPGEWWRERLRAPRPIGEVVAQGGEVATDWKRGNIPLQLNGIVTSPQAEAQLACSCGARCGAGERHPRAGRWRSEADGLWLRPLPGGHALHPDEIKMSPQPARGGDARASRHGRARPGHAPHVPRSAAMGNIDVSAARPAAFLAGQGTGP